MFSVILLLNPLVFALAGMELLVIKNPYHSLRVHLKNGILFLVVFNVVYYSRAVFNINFTGVFIIYSVIFVMLYELLDKSLKLKYHNFINWLAYFSMLFIFLGLSVFLLPYWTYTYSLSFLVFVSYICLSLFIIYWVKQYYIFFLYKGNHIQSTVNIYLLFILSIILSCFYVIEEILKGL